MDVLYLIENFACIPLVWFSSGFLRTEQVRQEAVRSKGSLTDTEVLRNLKSCTTQDKGPFTSQGLIPFRGFFPWSKSRNVFRIINPENRSQLMMILGVIINHTEKLRNLDFVTYILISNIWFKHVSFFSVPKAWKYLKSLLVRPGQLHKNCTVA